MLITPSLINRTVTLPSSKSYLHRAITLASMCDETTVLHNVWLCDDINCTIEAMRQFGAYITYDEHTLTIIGGKPSKREIDVYCKESGSTLRFLLPLFAKTFDHSIFRCENGLLARPLNGYDNILPPLLMNEESKTVAIGNGEIASQVNVCGDISSQYITGLLLCFAGDSIDRKINITPPFLSRPYVDITLSMLSQFGVDAHFTDEYTIEIKGGNLCSPKAITIEPDFSQLAFFAVAGVLCGSVKVLGLPQNSLQGDKRIIEIIKQCGGAVSDDFVFTKSLLHAIEIDVSDCPDLFPILTVLLAHANGSSKITGISRLKYKESNRVASMVSELTNMGHDIFVVGDSVIVSNAMKEPSTLTLNSHNDHRIAMSLAVAIKASDRSFFIEGFDCINKSFPEFSL